MTLLSVRSLGPAFVLLLATACGTSASPAAAPTTDPVVSEPPVASSPAVVPSQSAASPTPSESPSALVPFFATPESAMRYLAAAWNRRDLVSVKHVTTKSARDALEVMRAEAVELQLARCTRNNDRKDYDCTFTHGFPAGYKGHPEDAGYARSDDSGTATFVVGPADRSGWYMTVLESCG